MKYKLAFEHFTSIASLIRANATRGNNRAFAGRTRESDTCSSGFAGTENYEEAETLLQTGWDEVLDKLKGHEKRRVDAVGQAERRRPKTAVVGYAPCVPNAIMGLPNSMIATEAIKQKVKTVSIVYGVDAPASCSVDTMIESGITVLNIVKTLELQGIRVKLTVEGCAAVCGNDLCIFWVDVKGYRDALDIKKLTFPFANPSMCRRIGFRWEETYEGITNTGYTSGYGKPLDRRISYEDIITEYKGHGILSDNDYYVSVKVCENCDQDVDEVMKKIGIDALKLGPEN